MTFVVIFCDQKGKNSVKNVKMGNYKMLQLSIRLGGCDPFRNSARGQSITALQAV